jgi:hypothetical protein
MAAINIRRNPGESVHDYQHRLVDLRLRHLENVKTIRDGLSKTRNREALKEAHHTLKGHLRAFHGYRHHIGLDELLEALQGRHDAAHEAGAA